MNHVYQCSDGPHNSFCKTVVESPEWKAWGKVAYEHGYDYHECHECGWISVAHFKAFMEFCVTHREQALRKELLEKIDALPSDFCNDGVYTDKEMVDCLAGVLRSREEAIREIIRGGNNK